MHRYHMKYGSGNGKTGPIPVTTSSRSTCPPSCPYLGEGGCYGENYPMRHHWNNVDAGKYGVDFSGLLAMIRAMPKNQLWRHNQVGDLPGTRGKLNRADCLELARANGTRQGFTYTHYRPTRFNRRIIHAMMEESYFTVNLSTANLAQADEYAAMRLAPVVTIVGADAPAKGTTPAGNPYVVCPAQLDDVTTCATCGLCAKSHFGRPIVAFIPHGTRAKRVEAFAV